MKRKFDIDWQYGCKDGLTLTKTAALFKEKLKEMKPGDSGIEFWVTIWNKDDRRRKEYVHFLEHLRDIYNLDDETPIYLSLWQAGDIEADYKGYKQLKFMKGELPDSVNFLECTSGSNHIVASVFSTTEEPLHSKSFLYKYDANVAVSAGTRVNIKLKGYLTETTQ